MNTFSFRAECGVDVTNFINQSRQDGVVTITKSNGIGFEIQCTQSFEAVQEAMRRVIDGHVMLQTLRPVPLSQNSLNRNYDLV
jgi:hypothetical protein